MRKLIVPVLLAALVLIYSCSSTKNSTSAKDDGKLDFTIVQINDVYEIAPLDGGKAGGMARVATIKKQYMQ